MFVLFPHHYCHCTSSLRDVIRFFFVLTLWSTGTANGYEQTSQTLTQNETSPHTTSHEIAVKSIGEHPRLQRASEYICLPTALSQAPRPKVTKD